MLRSIVGVGSVLLSVLVTVAWSSTTTAGGRSPNVSLVSVAGPTTAAITNADLRRAWSDAVLLAESMPGLGYPWADAATGSLVLRVTGTIGQQVASSWAASGAVHPNPKIGAIPKPRVPVRVESVTADFSTLEGIKNDATRLVNAGLPDSNLIYETAPDWEHNRILVTLSRRSDALLDALATRYGPDLIAATISPRPFTLPQQGTRSQDRSYFWGGAIINTGTHGCSSGFSWTSGSIDYMLSAGHCASSGSSLVSTTDANGNVVENMGSITSGSRENWTDGVGTTYFTGDSTYRGDLALIQVLSGKHVGAAMYSGTYPDQTSATVVRTMWNSVPQSGESYCTSGSNTYAICGWSVNAVRINHQYSNGEWAYNVTKGLKTSGTSNNGGDSGGPVYTVNADGTIAAKGIHSGGTVGPSSCGIWPWQNCIEIFTDILLAYQYFPGWLKTA